MIFSIYFQPDAHERTPVPRSTTPARVVQPLPSPLPQAVPNLPQPASKTRLMRRQTVGAIQTTTPNTPNSEMFQGSL